MIDTAGSNPGEVRIAHLKPEPSGKDSMIQMDPVHFLDLELPFDELVESLEAEFQTYS
jgi:hypothetical protein